MRRLAVLLLPLLLAAGAAAAAAAGPATPPSASPAPPPPTPPPPPPPPHKNATLAELLPLYGLPPGVFPSTVTAFSLADNGSLSVDLAGPCYVHFEYLTYFAPRVTGVLRYGSLSDLQGVQVRRFLFWLNVIRIKVDLPPPPRYVYLDIGWITRKLPASDFQSVHSCEESNRCRLSSALAVAARWFQDFFAQF
ncbi:hypothetical protein PAHAL_9G129100 [Panicum hallii]|jgi:hypothetical protein|uniref:Uncharacterized protein n=1 Tax=Panicum hallii TaxID=206008 RepID=A0A2S3IJ54_9POAL|nr:BEN domain-containing protein 4-like [Panicum hallii]XP_025795574.1 BEN domain-containing protein 4-like [Panicum hallii]XP_025795575.1 BEN domain-containing protein 4-like [Panicum hallii]XP_025795576.1 BEN domain-containing protein 4-like [Panicum hallii]XP_025795577.1 BEN domain-containing protein 4-like [Panicum hallii]PAN45586.1 hypothetical protein PAHAL_9G129100 [Panicum hallii]